MNTLLPITTALFLFPLVAFALLLPWMLYSYRRFGYLSVWNAIVLYSFIFYFICAYFFVILPLPASRDTCALFSSPKDMIDLNPFSFIKDISKDTSVQLSNPSTYIRLFRERAFLQVLFNFFLLLPLGVYIRYFYRDIKGHWKAFFAGLAVSIFFEITQLTALYGFYNCAYRIFDVNDLILNTLGAWFGFFVAPLVLRWFPSQEHLMDKADLVRQEPQARPFARLLALMIDVSLAQLIGQFWGEVGIGAAYFVILALMPLLIKGRTPGNLLLRFCLETPNSAYFFIRFGAIYLTGALMSLPQYIGASPPIIQRIPQLYQQYVIVGVSILVWITALVIFVHALNVIISKKNKSFYFDRMAKVQSVSIYKTNNQEEDLS